MISVKNLNVSYEKKQILSNLSFEVNNHLTVLGANGSGKSTLAKALCGLLPFNGEVLLNEKDIKTLDLLERAQNISYIPATLENFDPYIGVRDFILMGRYVYKKPYLNYSVEDYEAVDEVLARLSLEALSNERISALSSGQKQLCMIASALVQKSKIIIFDEPTANLDPAHSVEISKIIRDLQGEHQSILITHDLNFAQSIEGEILFLKEDKGEYYKDSNTFFELENLHRCYETMFLHSALGMKYD